MMAARDRWVGLALLGTALVAPAAHADIVQANPSNYQALLVTLKPGDTLALAAGTYPRLNLAGMHGAEGAYITISGPATGAPAIIEADLGPCCNTIQLDGTSYVALENLTIDGRGVEAADGINAKGAPVHHIRVEGCKLIGHDASQQTVAISTKTTAWNWVIRRNTISGAGTGLYLGNSDGSSPFVAGVIEYNVVDDTVGYGMQIKYQTARPTIAGLPTSPASTVIRHNVFVKNDRPSPDGARPNLLVGGFPSTGDGSSDRYEIYGNVFVHNSVEALLQASGRVTIHDNLFVDVAGTALVLTNHDAPLRQAHVYNNTFYGASRGISVSGTLDQGDIVRGNLIFAATPISGGSNVSDNLTAAVASAAEYVAAPSLVLGEFDLYPLAGKVEGTALDLSPFAADLDHDRDFNGTTKGGMTFRGAYAGAGTNPGWHPVLGIKGEVPTDDPSAPDGGMPTNPGTDDASGGGCCSATDPTSDHVPWGALLAGMIAMICLRGRRARRRS